MITNNDQIWILSIPGAQFHLMWYALIDSMKYQADMEVSWHRATPKSSIWVSDFPPEKPSIYGVPPFMETHIWLYLKTPKDKNALNAAAAKLEGSELGSEGRPWPQIGIKTHCPGWVKTLNSRGGKPHFPMKIATCRGIPYVQTVGKQSLVLGKPSRLHTQFSSFHLPK